MVQTLDCSLKALQIPGLVSYTPLFGTKKADGHGLTTAEINRNIMMPFMKQRPISGIPTAEGLDPPLGVIDTDTIATPIEYDANFAVNQGVKLQLADPTYEGQVVRVVASFSSGAPAEITLGITGNPEKVLLNKEEVILLFAVNRKWQNFDDNLSKSIMPLNPVCAYDMADIATDETPFLTLPAPIIKKAEANIYENSEQPLKTNTLYHISITSKWTGDALPYLMVFRSDWKDVPLSADIDGTQDFYVTIPSEGTFYFGIWMHGSAGYQVQSADSVTIEKLTIAASKAATVIDGAGNMQHSLLAGVFERIKDNDVGSAIYFKRGNMQREPIPYMGFGKKWTHSRWVKINTQQEKNAWKHIWDYGDLDNCYFEVKADGTINRYIYMVTYKDTNIFTKVTIPLEKFSTDKWMHVVVMTDLQATYCRKVVYINCQKVADVKVDKDFTGITPTNSGCFDMAGTPNKKHTRGALATLLFFDRFLTEAEVQWLASNPYYPAKRYSLAEYKADENRKLLEMLQQQSAHFVPKSAFELAGSTLSINM